MTYAIMTASPGLPWGPLPPVPPVAVALQEPVVIGMYVPKFWLELFQLQDYLASPWPPLCG